MPNKFVLPLALASAVFSCSIHSAGFASSVVTYTPGSGVQAGYTSPSSALGAPSTVTPGQFGGPVDPFSPPYLAEQVVSIGAGGSLTVEFATPVADDVTHAFGLDFIVFGNSGFQIVNGDFSGGGITDGSFFGANTGPTRVSVSNNGSDYFELTPSLAPVVDGPFPTDGSGSPFVPLDPSIKPSSFAGQGLTGIRQLYNGSAGGAAFDIAWARTSSGEPANLGSIRFVKIDVLSGVSEIDAVAAVPEPSVLALTLVSTLAFCFRKVRRS